MTDASTREPPNKVARLIQEHELTGMGDELKKYWTGDGVERMSLRNLAAYFNKALLESEMERAGMSTLKQEVETVYTNLTSDSVSAGVETETKNTLSEHGLDPETLERSFVSYQSIRTYLNEYQNTTYQGVPDEEKIQNDIDVINRLATRAHSVAVDRIDTQMSTGRISSSDFEVFIETNVLCQDCGSQYAVTEFLEQRGCDCEK